MEWLKGNWLKVTVLVFTVGGWAVLQEIDAQQGRGHRQMVCYEECLKHCRAWCASLGRVDDCECPKLCEERCG